MKVVGVVGSPRKKGNTSFLVEEVLSAVEDPSIETDIIYLSEYTIQNCDGCDLCVRERRCPKEDDMTRIEHALLEADCIILGAPSYFGQVPAVMKTFIDRSRTMKMQSTRLKNKYCAVITHAGLRNGGQEMVASSLVNFALGHGMLVFGTCEDPVSEGFFVAGSLQKDDGWRFVKKDPLAVQTCESMGKRIRELLKKS
ncbi:MAG: flavodoxin family protein [Theionarchaea archaeon]|nr:flavodoxin family protein [Theionarchaea archaeon]MBU7036667.1 flavodoxin family protein [Theionarchaea archaeon]